MKNTLDQDLENVYKLIISKNTNLEEFDFQNETESNQNKEKLQSLFPNCFDDGNLNIEKLKQQLGLDNDLEQNERYGLNWVGKSKAFKESTKLSTKTLTVQKDKSLNFDESDNIIIEGDNLEVLRLLKKSYFEKIDVIYIDPPYNTGNDFVYNDDFKQSKYEFDLENNLIDEDGNKVQTCNTKSDGKFHTNWLNMMYPRLLLARKLLKEDGVIFISIDDNEQARLKMLCDEVFGEENFVNQIVWISNRSGRQISNSIFTKTYETILVYSKNSSKNQTLTFDRKYINNLMPEIYNNDELKILKDDISTYILQYELHNQNLKQFNLKTRPNLYYPIYTNGTEISLEKKPDWYEIYPPTSNNIKGVWRWSKEKVQNEKHNLEVVLKNNKYAIFPKKRNIVFSAKDIILSSKINTKTGSHEMKMLGIEFTYPKPSSLIKLLLNTSNKDALILDFFAGSGTTGQAVMELNKEDGGNRKYILVQFPEKSENLENTEFETIADITRERIKRSIQMYDYEEKGFKAFKLSDSNFKSFDATTDESIEEIQKKLMQNIENIKEDVSIQDLIYEIILRDTSLTLDSKLESKVINNNKVVYNDTKDYLFLLEPTMNNNYYDYESLVKVVKELFDEQSINIFMQDKYFRNDQDKINFAEAIKDIDDNLIKIITL